MTNLLRILFETRLMSGMVSEAMFVFLLFSRECREVVVQYVKKFFTESPC
jgi:hypothetical protein